MLAGPNGARGRIRTCTGDALDVVSLLLDYASEMDGASCRCCPGADFLTKEACGLPQGGEVVAIPSAALGTRCFRQNAECRKMPSQAA